MSSCVRKAGQAPAKAFLGLSCGGVTLVLPGHRSKTVTQRSQINFSVLKTCILVFKNNYIYKYMKDEIRGN